MSKIDEKLLYGTGEKGKWRRQCWNIIDKKNEKPRRQTMIHYLAGENDYDRKIALSKGYMPENMVAIERDKKTAKKLRKKKTNTVVGDLISTIGLWNEPPMNIIICD